MVCVFLITGSLAEEGVFSIGVGGALGAVEAFKVSFINGQRQRWCLIVHTHVFLPLQFALILIQ